MISSKEMAKRLWEDAQAADHGGYFKLWAMEKVKHNWNYYRGDQQWSKRRVIGIFPTREPCEAFMKLVKHIPDYDYEFCSFDHGIDHIKGRWVVEIADEGDSITRSDWGLGLDADPTSNYRHGEDRIRGEGRTKEEAIANARRYREELRIWNCDERPKRAKGCWCQPRVDKMCGPCDDARITERKKMCGCPNCDGKHRIFIKAPLEELT